MRRSKEPSPQPSVLLDGGVDPVDSAKVAGLRYVTDTTPGIRRQQVGRHVRYIGIDGTPIRDPTEIARITTLGIPPAWIDAWICPTPRGHLQATGRDAKGRKQYRYHPRWRVARDETKFHRMVLFGETLPMIRAWIAQDLARPGLVREKVLATVVALLDRTHIRIGNEEYARVNASSAMARALEAVGTPHTTLQRRRYFTVPLVGVGPRHARCCGGARRGRSVPGSIRQAAGRAARGPG